MNNNNHNHQILFQGIHGISQLEYIALPRIAQALDEITGRVDAIDARVAALEAAQKSTNNEDVRSAIIDAHNAIEKALNHFRTTAENHKK